MRQQGFGSPMISADIIEWTDGDKLPLTTIIRSLKLNYCDGFEMVTCMKNAAFLMLHVPLSIFLETWSFTDSDQMVWLPCLDPVENNLWGIADLSVY